MKKQVELLLIVTLLLFSRSRCSGTSLIGKTNNELSSDFNSDSIPGRITYGIIKFNPVQSLFGEIPISFELICPKESSIQFQVGLIFPFNKESGARKIFESNGTNADASSKGLLSYRNSPYNSFGLSFKIEFRKYGRYFYHGPQFMYKNSFYKNATFAVFGTGITLDQTESKFSNIFGFGYILGRQSDGNNIVFDWYGCIGFRYRTMSVNVIKIRYPQTIQYPNTTESKNSFYPFINLGVRIGFKLKKTTSV